MDDGDSKNKTHNTRHEETDNSLQRDIFIASDVLSPVWLRRFIQINNGSEWFLLGSRYSFLFGFRLFLVVLYLTHEILKNQI